MNQKTSGETSGQAGDNQGFTPVASLLAEVYVDLEEHARTPVEITGLATGFKSLNERTDGFHRGEVMLIGARPTTGKSALITNLAVRAAMSNDQPLVAMISADLSVKQMLMRMMALDARVDLEKLRTEKLEIHDWQQLTEASRRLGELGIMMCEPPPSLSVMRKNLVDIKHGGTGLDIVLVDDLQSLAGSMGVKHSAKGMVSLMRGLHTIARELDVAVIVTARLNAAVESRADKRPRISDLYQTRAIEPEAYVIMLLYRDEMYHHRPEYEGLMEIIVAKRRRGELGMAALLFWPEFSRFEDVPGPDSNAVDAMFDSMYRAGLQRTEDEQKESVVNQTDVEMRYVTGNFPNLVLPNRKPVCPIEIDVTALSDNEEYRDGGWEELIRIITATWVKQHAYAGKGTIWAWGSPSVNFGHQSFSMFYAVSGMSTNFRKFLGKKIRVLGKYIRPDSDYVTPSLEDGWNAMCHIEDGKAWEPLDPTLWEEIAVE